MDWKEKIGYLSRKSQNGRIFIIQQYYNITNKLIDIKIRYTNKIVFIPKIANILHFLNKKKTTVSYQDM